MHNIITHNGEKYAKIWLTDSKAWAETQVKTCTMMGYKARIFQDGNDFIVYETLTKCRQLGK